MRQVHRTRRKRNFFRRPEFWVLCALALALGVGSWVIATRQTPDQPLQASAAEPTTSPSSSATPAPSPSQAAAQAAEEESRILTVARGFLSEYGSFTYRDTADSRHDRLKRSGYVTDQFLSTANLDFSGSLFGDEIAAKHLSFKVEENPRPINVAVEGNKAWIIIISTTATYDRDNTVIGTASYDYTLSLIQEGGRWKVDTAN